MTSPTLNTLVPQSEAEVSIAGRREDAIVESPAAKPAIVGTQGQYTLKSWRDASGKPRQFPCTVLNFSSEVIKLAGPVTGSMGEWVVASFEDFGQFEGPVAAIFKNSFAMWIVATVENRKKLASKVAWVKDKKIPNRRRHERLIPSDPNSTLCLVDGHSAPCQIIDYSLSGVALSSDINLEIGAVVKVGSVLGQVRRLFSKGCTIEFLSIQNTQSIENLFTRR